MPSVQACKVALAHLFAAIQGLSPLCAGIDRLCLHRPTRTHTSCLALNLAPSTLHAVGTVLRNGLRHVQGSQRVRLWSIHLLMKIGAVTIMLTTRTARR